MAIRPNLLFFNSFNAVTQQNVGVGYRYIKWRITKIKNYIEGVVQAGDLVLLKTGTTLQYNQSAVATSPDSAYASPFEQVQNILDNNPITKWCNVNWGNSQTGESIIYIDNKTKIDFDCYYYNTANDAEHRDPISWTLEVSNDNINWTIVDTVNDATITNNRESQTQIFCTILQPTPTPTPTPSPTPTYYYYYLLKCDNSSNAIGRSLTPSLTGTFNVTNNVCYTIVGILFGPDWDYEIDPLINQVDNCNNILCGPTPTPTLTPTSTPTPSPTPSDYIESQLTTNLLNYQNASDNDWISVTQQEYNDIANNVSGVIKIGNNDTQVNTRDLATGYGTTTFGTVDANTPLTIPTGYYVVGFVAESWNQNGQVQLGYTTTYHTGAPTYMGNSPNVIGGATMFFIRKRPNSVEGAPASTNLYPVLNFLGLAYPNAVPNTFGWQTPNSGTTWLETDPNGQTAKIQILITNVQSWPAPTPMPTPTPTPTPTETPTPTPTPTQPLVDLTINVQPGATVNFDFVNYTTTTTIYVNKDQVYNLSCTPPLGQTFVTWYQYGMSFTDSNSQATTVSVVINSGANFIASFV